MCGGAGTRLWPVSRESMPKQFVPLLGRGSTFQDTVQRVADPALFARPIVITSADFRFVVAEQLKEIGIEADIVLEPMRRDSGPAVAVAAVLAGERDPEATVLVLAADHVMRKPDAFIAACKDGTAVAKEGHIVTFGIHPDNPSVNYGYIRPGRKLNGGTALAVDSFVEKPDAATAAAYVADNYLWNSGNFMFNARAMLREIERVEPAMAKAAKLAVAGLTHDLEFLRLAAEPFAEAPRKSIDYSVMQHTQLAAVIPVDFGWSDVGSWNSLWDVLDHDEAGNAVEGPVALMDCRNSLVRSDSSMLTAVVGLDNVAVITTDDAVLVVARDKAEMVKSLVDQIKALNRREAVEHRRIYRPWGYYQGVDSGNRYQVKRIVVKPGGKLSLQKHFHRAEHWVVVNGTALVTRGEEKTLLRENESIFVPLGCTHRLENPGKLPLNLIEVQSGAYLGEDDIVRVDDIYQPR
jgi:mannose-1-phosphate guanylyltransferase/mannose-6-phosphate isomerase